MDLSRSTRRPPAPLAALAGLAAAALGLGVAELVAGIAADLRSPVLDVGDRVIDSVPAWLKDLAISWFGTNDKIALLVGIGVALALYAAVVGVVGLRHRLVVGVVGVGLFGAVGSWAALAARTGRSLAAVTPAVVGSLVAAAALVGLAAAWDPARSRPRRPAEDRSTGARPAAAPTGTDEAAAAASTGPDRRRFLAVAGAAVAVGAGAAATGRWLGGRFSAAASRAGIALPAAARPLAPIPPGADVGLEGVSPFFTPNADFYRIDTALVVPQVPAETWQLRVTGMVDRELRLDYAGLLDRELVEADITMTCVSNEVGGGLVGTARWLGVRLDDLLAEAGIEAEADQVVGRSVDGYTCGFPVSALDGRSALVAVGMNGEPLPLEHGFPARLIVPGLYGYVSATKWLTEIELTRFDRFDHYWVPRGYAAQAPIKTQTRIDTPRGLASLAPGAVGIGGVAWAQTRGITGVQVRIDDGPWLDADLAPAVNDETWRQWTLRWEATPGRHAIAARATDGTGAIQTEDRSEPLPDGATGWHQIVVLVREP